MRNHAILMAAGLAATVPGQGTFQLDRATPGIIGATLDFEFSGASLGVQFLLLGFPGGPTVLPPEASALPLAMSAVPPPLSLLQPVVVNQGVTAPVSIPPNPGFAGFLVAAQAVTLSAPALSPLLAQVSNPVTVQLGNQAVPQLLLDFPSGRVLASLIRDPDPVGGPGSFLVAGGAVPNPLVPLHGSTRFDVRTLAITDGPNLLVPRVLGASVELLDGRTMLIGGFAYDQQGSPVILSHCEVYDPVADTFDEVAPMLQARMLHAAALLQDGRVLVVGGTNGNAFPQALFTPLASTEIYDPALDAWTAGPAMALPVQSTALARLPNGQVLRMGGGTLVPNPTPTPQYPFPVMPWTTDLCEIFDPLQNAWLPAPPLPGSRASIEALVLHDGRILALGGTVSSPGQPTLAFMTNQGSVFDPHVQTNNWTTLPPMHSGRIWTRPVELPNGDILVAGGVDGAIDVFGGPSGFLALDRVERLDAAFTSWSLLPGSMAAGRGGHATVMTPDGLLVLLGGSTNGPVSLPNKTIETLRP